jgi:6-phosphogluconolactonase
MAVSLPDDRGELLVVDDGEALARSAAARVVEVVRAAVDERGRALLALSGGSTPKRMGQLLADAEFAPFVPWNRIEVFWGDERWVPLDSPESNAGEALRGWLAAVAPTDKVHPVDTALPSAVAAAAAYEAEIRRIAGSVDNAADEGGAVPVFDLILLGMGDDGHTASLFPHTAALTESAALVVVNHVPKLAADRITFTYPLIAAARDVALLIGGAAKAATLREVLEGPPDPARLPSQAVRAAGRLTWIVDRAAAASLGDVG